MMGVQILQDRALFLLLFFSGGEREPSVMGRREKKIVCGCYVIGQTLSRWERRE